ncbi:hypothetical protein [Parabacteroides sp. PF5-6]|uniref:hypothetical protein n=1 Tax=Parabacteroides sp. PF5-6 TaxID=1742403 RepID=UPI002406A127|nr:hypothetical protein [Parabacteroides sp. PF5-6]MDF9829346.1 nitrite reductase/ring-hydroxylating ferredoxin subunit [Parabacteroides sp. PF5-6]
MKRFWCCLVVLLIVSCTKTEEARIPLQRVYLELDLTFEDKELLNLTFSKTYIRGTSNLSEKEYTGFGGVYVYYSPQGYYVAYDLACPVEAVASTRIKIEKQGDAHAICPQCKTKYDLESGYPLEGIGTYRLQPYIISRPSASKLIVRN